jgi:hypothetical protein
MTRHLAALAVLALAAAEPAAAQAPSDVSWAILPSGRPAASDTRQLTIRYRKPDGRRTSTGSARPLRDIPGLSEAALASAEGGPVSFRLASDPGTLECTGVIGQGSGTGNWRLPPAGGHDQPEDRQRAGAAPFARRAVASPTFTWKTEPCGAVHFVPDPPPRRGPSARAQQPTDREAGCAGAARWITSKALRGEQHQLVRSVSPNVRKNGYTRGSQWTRPTALPPMPYEGFMPLRPPA